MKEVVSVADMRRFDENTIKNGVSSLVLMQKAGQAVAESYDFLGKTAIVCGSGNNAGDGCVLANEIHDGTRFCVLFLMENKFSKDGKFYFDKCLEKNIPYCYVDEDTDFGGYDTVVDCIFGTGYRGAPDEKTAKVIDKINNSGAFVISVDINSGLNGDNGLGDIVVKSDLTVSIGTLKSGHFLGKAKDVIKTLRNVDIGIKTEENTYKLCEKTDFSEFTKDRPNFSHKGTYGTVGIIGGCENYCGAVKLASLALSSLRAGCGISRIIIPKKIIKYVAPQIKECTIMGVGRFFVKKTWQNGINGVRTLAIGMGWGKGKNHNKILSFVTSNFDGVCVIDADGINALSKDKRILRNKKCQIILTPHIGEFSRFCNKSIKEILADPINIAKNVAKEYGVIIVLKGTTTVITDGEKVYLTDTGCAGMGTAGSGDVLSGIIAGVTSANHDNLLLSVAYATYINGLAGELAQREKGDVSMTSGDTVEKISTAVLFCKNA